MNIKKITFLFPFFFKVKNFDDIKYCHSDLECKIRTQNIYIQCCHISPTIYVCCHPNYPRYNPIPL